MTKRLNSEIRQDCLIASQAQQDVRAKLARQHIAVTGGTGFLGTWLAETVAALNDEYKLGIKLDLFARNATDWAQKHSHLVRRSDIQVRSQDVRSSFEFSKSTSMVVHAAGIPNNRVHSSDPLRVHQTTIAGMNNVLAAASQLDSLVRLVNVSSCLVVGTPQRAGALTENDSFPMPSGALHTVYADAKRAAEMLSSIYRSQFRLPVCTVRPFTLIGPFQELDRPWAINNFMRDVVTGNEIRIHGDGTAQRSYLYGSDAAWWTLSALAKGVDGEIYNLGSARPVTHSELAELIVAHKSHSSRVVLNTAPSKQTNTDDLYPDISATIRRLGVAETCGLKQAVAKTYAWYSEANV